MFNQVGAFVKLPSQPAQTGNITTATYTIQANSVGVFTIGFFNFISLFDGFTTMTAQVNYVQPNGSIAAIENALANVILDCVAGGLQVQNNTNSVLTLIVRSI